jgi:hypothetical protein
MSRVIDLCECSDGSVNNGGCPNTVSVPSLFLSRKRPWSKEEGSNDAHPRNENVPGNKGTAAKQAQQSLQTI